MQLYKDTVQQYLHMGRQVQGKLTRWLVSNNYSLVTYIKVIKDRVSFPVRFSSYGRK